MNDSNSITVTCGNDVLTGTSNRYVTTVLSGGANTTLASSVTATSCGACGGLIVNGQWHVCYPNSFQTTQAKPHCCPVCNGRGRVLFDPENPFRRGSSVEHWPCRPCLGSGVIWGTS